MYKYGYQFTALVCSLLVLAACTITVDPLQTQLLTTTDPSTTEPSATDAVTLSADNSVLSAHSYVLPTEVTYVQTLATINIRSGPGLNYAEVSFIEKGQIAPVFGISKDRNWWLVLCPDTTVGCWMTAGPSYTQPTTEFAGTSNAPLNGPDDPPVADTTVADTQVADTTGDIPFDETGEVIIDDLSVRLLESSPAQLEAVITGQLPDACTFFENLDVVREGTTFRIRMSTARQPNQRCAPMLTPFEETVPFDVSGLPAGDYDVRINGIVVPFALAVAAEPAPAESGPAVVEEVEPVVLSDPAQGSQSVNVVVSGYVPDTCTAIGEVNQRQEGNTFYVEIATTRSPGVECTQVITEFERTIPLEVTGLPAGLYEVIVNNVGQSFTWPGPDAAPPIEVPTETPTVVPTATTTVALPPTVPTDVTNIVALQNVQIYSGPSVDSPIIGQLLMGESAGVIDSNLEGTWWHIQCTLNAESNCWVAADPLLTQVSEAGE